MKKQTIALALLTALSSGAVMANNIDAGCEAENSAASCTITDNESGEAVRITADRHGNEIREYVNENGEFQVHEVREGYKSGYTTVDGDGKNLVIRDSDKNGEKHTAISNEQGTLISDDTGDNYAVLDSKGNVIEGAITPDTGVKRPDHVNMPDTGVKAPPVERSEVIKEVERQREWNKQAESAGKELANSVDKKFGQAERSISDNATAIADNKAAIDNLGEAMQKQGQEMRERYDGVKASMHAITNAKPVAYDVGEFAVGAGLGAAGSKQAVAIGGAYRFNEQWAGSFTVNHETAGRHTKADTSAGIGAQFSFK
ncbi:YadA C-terminal domain-containing protein [Vibrio cionasavignyae]|uniref:YadA C-terminal domain-containing protein n=1 Tax=Vibrio cionasavignyae TaxID=2910252 RepID=UPI003D0AF22A